MTDDLFNSYLWDGTGEPDADVRRLEDLLGRYRYPKVVPPSSTEAHAHDDDSPLPDLIGE